MTNLKKEYEKQADLKRQHDAAAEALAKAHQQTGSAAFEPVGDFVSNWKFYDLYHECHVAGNPADADQQQGTDIVRRSNLPGVQQADAVDIPGRQTLHHCHTTLNCFALTVRTVLW